MASLHSKFQPVGSVRFLEEERVCESGGSADVSDLELAALEPHCCHLWWPLVETKARRLADAVDVPRWKPGS